MCRDHRFAIAFLLLFMTTCSIAGTSSCTGRERIERASDIAGRVLVIDGAGNEQVIEPETATLGAEALAPRAIRGLQVAADHCTVGWVVYYNHCCGPDAIPLVLHLYRHDAHHRIQRSMPIWRWAFAEQGRDTLIYLETVHGGFGRIYERLDTASGRLVARWEPEVGPDNQILPNQMPPAWALPLASDVTTRTPEGEL
ncbi:hypothetical protein C7S18_22200 [Ahniella affigens]|uniref:DUF3304 domain-containing protein n=1 Tax=Ahniella affigens TaxID=2021234 RepID=A0A2P1PXZ5_9GAMM|nr:hypothetical protein [Ahniella affigens]AVP99719.1 hypothetical protein C7S18_22200 [Ahniella affigens]